MNERGRKAVFAEDLHRLLKSVKLIAREGLFRFIVRRGQMRHQSIDVNVCELFGGLREFGNLIGAHAQTSHSRVDLDVNIRS